jgi:trehalose-phosphatase
MNPEERQAKLIEWVRQAQHLWLFLDYDGTLADFAPTPEHIEPDPEVIRLLGRLARKPNILITILSGRRLQHVRALVPISGVYLVGAYGLELLTPGGETIQRLQYDAVRPALEIVKPQWEQAIRGREGFFLEDKGWTLALHARFAREEEAEDILAQARRVANREVPDDRFRILGGHKFLEVAPRLASKKETLTYLLNLHRLPGPRLIYIGDDDKDEEAFSAVHANRGVAIKVRQPSQAGQPTEADFFFESPAETLQWLKRLSLSYHI